MKCTYLYFQQDVNKSLGSQAYSEQCICEQLEFGLPQTLKEWRTGVSRTGINCEWASSNCRSVASQFIEAFISTWGLVNFMVSSSSMTLISSGFADLYFASPLFCSALSMWSKAHLKIGVYVWWLDLSQLIFFGICRHQELKTLSVSFPHYHYRCELPPALSQLKWVDCSSIIGNIHEVPDLSTNLPHRNDCERRLEWPLPRVSKRCSISFHLYFICKCHTRHHPINELHRNGIIFSNEVHEMQWLMNFQNHQTSKTII